MATNPSDIAYVAILAEQPDFSSLANLPNDKAAEAVGRIVQEFADRTQPPVKEAIIKLQQAGEVKDFHAFAICYCFVVLGTAHSVEVLAARQDIKSLNLVPHSELDTPVHRVGTPLPVNPSPKPGQGTRPSGFTPWNATAINRNEAMLAHLQAGWLNLS